MGEPTAAASQKTIVEDLEQYLPAKFNDQTELKAQVTPGKTSGIDFHLELSATGKKK